MDISGMIESHAVELDEFEKQFLFGGISEKEIFIKSQYFNATLPMIQKLSILSNNVNEKDDNLKGQIVKISSKLKAARLKYEGELKVLYLVSWN